MHLICYLIFYNYICCYRTK